MKPNVEHIEVVRLYALGLTGCACLVYAGLALAQNRPDPAFWWLPCVIGVCAAVLIFVVALLAGRDRAEAAMDELYVQTSRRAAAQAYWIALGGFIMLMIALKTSAIHPSTAIMVLGVTIGGAYPLLVVFHRLRQG